MSFIYLVLICLVRPCTLNQDLNNAGREFVLCYMDNQIKRNSPHDIEVYITTSSPNQANVTITTPLYDPLFFRSVSVNQNQVSDVKIPFGIRGSGVALENKGVRILASEDITVYSVNTEIHSTDAFVAFPLETLGTDYIIVTWSTDGTFMLVSTEDQTSIQIRLSQNYINNDVTFNGLTYSAGDEINITLDKWETFHVYSRGDLTGTRVRSSHVISVISGSNKTSVRDASVAGQTSRADHLVEQLLPVQSWGTEFITISTPGRTIGDFLKVVAAEDSANVPLGTSQSAILNAGDFQLFNLDSGRHVKVSADKGIMPVLFSKSSRSSDTLGDPAMSLLVPIQLYQSQYTFSTVDTHNGAFTNYLVIAIKAVNKEGLMLDQQSINETTDWTVVEGASDYVITTLHISPGVHSVNNTDLEATFLGMAFGNADANSYAYASGLRLERINVPTSIFTTTNAVTSTVPTTSSVITDAATTSSTAATEQTCGTQGGVLAPNAINNFCLILNMSENTSQMSLDQRLNALKNNSLIDKKKTSKVRRQYTSAPDDKLPTKIIGYVSIGVLVTVAVAIIILVDVVPSKSAMLSRTAKRIETMAHAQRMNQIYENEVARNETPAVGNDTVRDIFKT